MATKSFQFKVPSSEDIGKYIEKAKERILESVKEAYELSCMAAVNRAKMTDTYKDRTNNLRSSIGYVLYYNGEMVSEFFEAGGRGTGGGGEVSFTTSNGTEVSFTAAAKDSSGQEGVNTGRSLANMIALRHATSGFVAIIIAGMHYALYVEAMGYDVLTSSTLDITKDLQEYFDIINKEYGTRLRA
jgi:hypothetical protein